MVRRADQHLKTFLSILESTLGKIKLPNTACTRCRHGATRRWWESARFQAGFLAQG
jgi:hypothetical protein